MEPLQKLTKINSVFRNIFENNTVLHRQFLLHNIRKQWQDIMGKLADHCYPLNIQEGRLIIGVDSASLANKLYMVQMELLQKINKFLHGEAIILRLNFVAGSSTKKYKISEEEEKEEILSEAKISCPKCGGKMENWRDICFSCYQEEQQKKVKELRQILLKIPWTKCEGKSLEERVFFSRTRENLAETFYEKIRLKTATDEEKILAVLFYTYKKPEEISREMFVQTLAILANENELKEK